MFLKSIDKLSMLAESMAVLFIYGYCALMLAEVVARSQAKSLSFSWEFSQYAMAAIFALAAGPALRSGVHVRIGLISDLLSARTARWLDLIASVVALAIVALMVYALVGKVLKSFDRNIVATTVTQTPLWIPQFFVLWGFGQLWLDLLARLVRRFCHQEYEWPHIDIEHVDV